MNVFDLDLRIVRDYERFARSFTEIRAEDVHLVNQQDARPRRVLQCPHERALNKEVQSMQPRPDGFPICSELARLSFKEQPLKRGIELADGLLFIDAGIALQPLQGRVHREREGFR